MKWGRNQSQDLEKELSSRGMSQSNGPAGGLNMLEEQRGSWGGGLKQAVAMAGGKVVSTKDQILQHFSYGKDLEDQEQEGDVI